MNGEGRPKTRDFWDKLSILLPFLSGLLVTSVGLYFTVSYNRQANRVAELQTMERFIPQLTGNEESKKIAKQMILGLGNPRMVAVLTDILKEGTAEEKKLARATLGATAIVIFDNTNTAAVDDGGLSPAFAITRPHFITNIRDYHWNGGRGANPGTISLRRHDGSTFGPWQVTASSGQGGAPNVNWESSPNVTIPAGTYTVVDSDPATWSQNAQTARAGFSTVKGHPDQ